MSQLLGTITTAANAPPLDQEEWIGLVRSRPELVVPEPRTGTHPFTGERIVFRPHPATARLVIDGVEVGSMHWAMDDSNALIVWAEEDEAAPRVVAFALEVATSLGGVFLREYPSADAPG